MNENEIDLIYEDIKSFFDCFSWQEFCSSLTNEPKNVQNSTNLISSLNNKVSNGVLNPNMIFKSNDTSTLVDSFIINPDVRFFNIASHLLYDIKTCSSISFFELLITRSPKTMISLINEKDQTIFLQHVRLLIRCYIRKSDSVISNCLCKYQVSLVLRELFLIVTNLNTFNTKYSYNYDSSNENNFDTTNSVLLLTEIWKYNNKRNNLKSFYSLLKSESSVAFEFHSDNTINSILDFIERGSSHQYFDYSIVFGEIFGQIRNQYFVAVLIERMRRTSGAVIQAQLELIDKEAARPFREEFRKSERYQKAPFNSAQPSLSDKELILLSTQFAQKGNIPERLAQMHMFDKNSLVNKVAPNLRRLARSSNSAKLLVEALEKKKLIPVVKEAANWRAVVETLRDTDSTLSQFAEVINKAKNANEVFAKFLDSFNKALYMRHANDVNSFCDRINETVLIHLNNLQEFALTAAKFLASPLSEQHRRSLALIAIRLPLHEFVVQYIFDSQREVQILCDLHEAAIASCSFLTSSPNCSDKKALFFDPLLILRLRWRFIRGDFSGGAALFPEFASLVDNDSTKFLMWESGQIDPESVERRSQILARLGVTTNFDKFPAAFLAFLALDSPSQPVVEALKPFVMSCPKERILIPEKVNIPLLFQFHSVLWTKEVMCHPAVLKLLRENPPANIAQALLVGCQLNTCNFDSFPVGFYALVANYDKLIGEKPAVLDSVAELIRDAQSETVFEVNASLPKYAKVALIAYLTKNNLPLNSFFVIDEEFASFCIYFLICFKNFNYAVDLLSQNVDALKFLLTSCSDGSAFVGKNRWIPSLVEFAVFCAANRIDFKSEDWIRFVSLICRADWPQSVSENQYNFVMFKEYMKSLGILKTL